MNISATLYNNVGVSYYKQPTVETSRTQSISSEEVPGTSYYIEDSVTISNEGLAELKALLQSARSAKSTSGSSKSHDTRSAVKHIEHRANMIVMSKAISLYAANKV